MRYLKKIRKPQYLVMILCCICMSIAFSQNVRASETKTVQGQQEDGQCSVYFACPDDVVITGLKNGGEIRQVKGTGCVKFEEDYADGYRTMVQKGSAVSEPEFFCNTRTVLGWRLGIDGQTPYDFSSPVTEDIELYPILDRYIVRFWNKDAKWGLLSSILLVYVNAGETADDPEFADQKYFKLKGWTPDENYGSVCWNTDDPAPLFDFSTPIHRECSLYACWEKNYDYEIRVNYPYDFVLESFEYIPNNVIYAKHGETLNDTGLPEKWSNGERHVTRWTAKDGTPIDFSAPVTGDMVLYPVTDKCLVRFDIHGDVQNDLFTDFESRIYLNPGETVQEPVPRPSQRWNFYGWEYSVRNTETGEYLDIPYDFSKPVTSDLWLSANVERNWYSLNFLYNYAEYGDNGHGYSDKYDSSYYAGKNEYNCNKIRITKGGDASSIEASLGTPTIPGHSFEGWYLDESGTVPFDFHKPLTKDTVVYAKWKTVTANPTPPEKAKKPVKVIKTKKLVMSRKKYTLRKGKKIKLTVSRRPASANDKIKWTSSNKKVVSVNQKGRITARKKGKAVITAKTKNGKKATCKITVR